MTKLKCLFTATAMVLGLLIFAPTPVEAGRKGGAGKTGTRKAPARKSASRKKTTKKSVARKKQAKKAPTVKRPDRKSQGTRTFARFDRDRKDGRRDRDHGRKHTVVRKEFDRDVDAGNDFDQDDTDSTAGTQRHPGKVRTTATDEGEGDEVMSGRDGKLGKHRTSGKKGRKERPLVTPKK